MNESRSRVPDQAIGLIAAALLAAIGYAQEPTRSSPRTSSDGPPAATSAKGASSSPDKVVLKVGNERVTQADFDSLLAANPQSQQAAYSQGRRRIGEQYALMLALSQQALSDHLDASPEFRQKMALQRLQLLASSEYANLVRQAAPKPEEISQYYSAHPAEFEEARVRKVFVRKRPEGGEEGTLGVSPQEARTRAEAIRKALASGTDAKKVVEDFKNFKEVFIDSEPRLMRRGQLPAELDKAAFQLREGELSELQETPQALNFIQVVERRRRDLKEVTPQVEKKLQQQKVETALTDLKKKAGIWMDDEYFAPPPPVPSPAPAVTAPKADAAPTTPSAAPAVQTPKPAAAPTPAVQTRKP